MKRLQVPYNLEPYCLDMYAGWVDYIQDIYFAASPEIFPSARVWDYKDNYLDMQFNPVFGVNATVDQYEEMA